MTSGTQRRKPISKAVRFEVFKRDGFTCSYCGAHPPAVVLQIDHIHPVSKGGTNDADNLVTSCESCNQGKSARLLSAVPQSLKQKAKQLREREAQIAGYREVMDAVRRRKESDINDIEAVFTRAFGCSFTESFRLSLKKNFLNRFSIDELIDNAETACCRIGDPDEAVRYFCGINWGMLRERGLA